MGGRFSRAGCAAVLLAVALSMPAMGQTLFDTIKGSNAAGAPNSTQNQSASPAALAQSPVPSSAGAAQQQAQPAQGGMLYIDCGGGGLLTIDTVKNEVNNMPAKINATTIEWDTGEGVPGDIGNGWTAHYKSRYVLDRVAGTLSGTADFWEVDPSGKQVAPQSKPIASSTCRKADAPATKF